MMNEMTLALVETQRNGIAIDLKELDRLDKEYARLHRELQRELEDAARDAMGDTPINLNSPAQLSQLLFSRRIVDKKKWTATFNLGLEDRHGTKKSKYPRHYPKERFNKLINELSSPIYKTRAIQCPGCKGRGYISRVLKRGNLSKPRYRCSNCNTAGVLYVDSKERAGFKLAPRDVHDLSSHGFRTDIKTIKALSERTRNEATRNFIEKMGAFGAISTYRSTYIGGIRRGLRSDGCVHTQFMQTVTRTGRLSSRDPNFHNQPRGQYCNLCAGAKCRYCLETGFQFPIRRVVVSRWSGGHIVKADYSKLEFAIAVELSRCPVGLTDINKKGFDPHANSAREIGVSRQAAKAHTFKPLYGGTTGTAAERKYYKWFNSHYSGIAKWHTRLIRAVLRSSIVRLPSGREYAFPEVKRLPNGRIKHRTNVVNYPVQGFATADLVPVAYIEVWKAFRRLRLRSKLINEVHDEIVADAYPGEERICAFVIHNTMMAVKDAIQRRYDYEMVVPIQVETSWGKNWMEQEKVPEAWLKNPPKQQKQMAA